MFHPDILRTYLYRRTECQINAIDACTDTAEFYGVPFATLAQFFIAMGIDAGRLSLLVSHCADVDQLSSTI